MTRRPSPSWASRSPSRSAAPTATKPNTMKLIVTNPALEEALDAQGKDWKTFTRQEMRTVVCANCHVEYYFKGDEKYLTFPWEKGTKIEDIVDYYEEVWLQRLGASRLQDAHAQGAAPRV